MRFFDGHVPSRKARNMTGGSPRVAFVDGMHPAFTQRVQFRRQALGERACVLSRVIKDPPWRMSSESSSEFDYQRISKH